MNVCICFNLAFGCQMSINLCN